MDNEEEAILFSLQLKFNSSGQTLFEKIMLPLEELDNPDLQDLPISELKEFMALLKIASDVLMQESSRIFRT